jgi:hypothetical protein
MDARNLSFPSNYFDTILMMGNNFGVAGDVKSTKRLLGKIFPKEEDGMYAAIFRKA